MEYFVYILISEIRIGWSYVGSTSNLEQRMRDHNSGKTLSTKALRPLKIVYFERYPSKEAAYKRELFLKSGIGREEKRRILKHSGIV